MEMSNETFKISAVSYLNTYPFVYGLQHSGHLKNFHLDLAVPSACATRLASGESDIALVPVGAIPDFKDFQIISDFCIGAVRDVRTVLLMSQKPINEITEVYLDGDSRTSVQLVKVLANKFWKIDPVWKNRQNVLADDRPEIDSLVAIGDKTFNLSKKYRYIYDLAGEWIRYTSLPFVFAAWLSVRKVPGHIVDSLNQALDFGVSHINETLEYFNDRLPAGEDCSSYLKENISFTLDEKKREGMNLFLEMIRK
jgi:chorismate dehydratase